MLFVPLFGRCVIHARSTFTYTVYTFYFYVYRQDKFYGCYRGKRGAQLAAAGFRLPHVHATKTILLTLRDTRPPDMF